MTQWHLIKCRVMIKLIPELGKWTHLRGLWRRSTVSVQPNSWRFTRSAWIRRQSCWRESTILILSVRYNNQHILKDATFAVLVEYLVCILESLELFLFNFVPRFSCIEVFVLSPRPTMAPSASLWSTEERSRSTTLSRRGERTAWRRFLPPT